MGVPLTMLGGFGQHFCPSGATQLALSFGFVLHPGTVTLETTHGSNFVVEEDVVRMSPFEFETPIAAQSVPLKDASQLKQLLIGVSVFT